ncbi:putative Zinc finger C2HC domain-containing protein 1C [Plasmopara halstedii]
MADTEGPADVSLSAPIPHKIEARKFQQVKQKVTEEQTQGEETENLLNRHSWTFESSHKSGDEEDDGWMLAARRYANEISQELTKDDEADVEASVREALRLLEDSGEGEDDESGDDQCSRNEKAPVGYLDFVQEVMEERWTLEDRVGQLGHWKTTMEQVNTDVEDAEEHAEKEHEIVNENSMENKESAEEQTDEWLEAYTAKGRVYYYNRRSRESSWKKPCQFDSSISEAQRIVSFTDENVNVQRSVLSQSLGYHPSASLSLPPVSTIERSAILYCNFCGEQQPVDQFAEHFHECASVQFHKRRMSPLYRSFERAIGIMSEDSTLRSLHYASSFPDPKPHIRPEATTMQDSLLLLRPRRVRDPNSTDNTPVNQQSNHLKTQGAAENAVDQKAKRKAIMYPSRHTNDSKSAKEWKQNMSKRTTFQATNSANLESPTPYNMETCRYCNRSFAEGRLAKHEAVCPRVFGNEGSWGRGTPSSLSSPLKSRGARVTPSLNSTGSTTSKLHKMKDHTLQQSFKEHQATLVLCPCCHRKFAPSGAQQHIAICKGVQNRPKNPISMLRDYAIAG